MTEEVQLQPAAAPGGRWQVGRYTFQRYSRREAPQAKGRWGAHKDGHGVGFCKTPVGAFLALRRHIRDSAGLPPHLDL